MILLTLVLLQATPVTRATSAAPADRFSILADCSPRPGAAGGDVVVCAGNTDSPRIPLPDDRGPPDHAAPSNLYLRPDVALAAEGTPCAASQRGCQVGIGGPLAVAAVKGIATAISDGIADARVRKVRRHDAGKRVAIPLD